MSKMNDGGPAFARDDYGNGNVQSGMSLRDYFAASALQGLLAYSAHDKGHGNYHDENCTTEQTAMAAYNHADAMLKVRKMEEL